MTFGGVKPNPRLSLVREGIRLGRQEGVDFLLAVGGGSVIDCCKIVAAQALTANSEADIQPWLQELGLL